MATESIIFLVIGDAPSYFDVDSIRESYHLRPDRPNGRNIQNALGKSPGNVLYFPRPAPRQESESEHPFSKPLELMRHLILASCPLLSTIFDLFMGSGTTLRAAKNLGRKAIGIEIEEKYREIAVERFRQTALPP